MGLIDNIEKYAQHQNLSKDKKMMFDSFMKKGFQPLGMRVEIYISKKSC